MMHFSMTDPTMLQDLVWHQCPFDGCPANAKGFGRKVLLDKHLDQYHFDGPVTKQRNVGRSLIKPTFTCHHGGCSMEFAKKSKLDRHINQHRIKEIRQRVPFQTRQSAKDILRGDKQEPPIVVTTEVESVTEDPLGPRETLLARSTNNKETAEDSGYLDEACVADDVADVKSNCLAETSSSKSNAVAAPRRIRKMLDLPEDALHQVHCRLERSDLETMMLLNTTFRDYIKLHSDKLPLRRIHLAMMSRMGLYIQAGEAASDDTIFGLDWKAYLEDEALEKFSARLEHSFVTTMQVKSVEFNDSVIDVLGEFQDHFCMGRLQFVDVAPTSRTRFADLHAYFANVEVIDLSDSPKLNSIVTTWSIEEFIGSDKSTLILPRSSTGNSVEEEALLAFSYQPKTSNENKLSALEVYASSAISTTFVEMFIRATEEVVDTKQCPSTLLKLYNPPPQDLRAYRKHMRVFADGLYTLSKGDVRITYSAATRCLQCQVNPLYK